MGRLLGLLYELALALALLLLGPFLLLRRGGHYRPTAKGRLTLELPEGPRQALWVHAVSVGEVGVAAALARGLAADLPLLVTTITPTGQERARKLLGERAGVGYLPLDLTPLVERFRRRLAPAALLLVEGDYWPVLLARCARHGIPVAVVNGRVGDKTLRRLGHFPRVARWLLGNVDRFVMQTEEDARRLAALGVPAAKVVVAGNLKYEAAAPAAHPELERDLQRLAHGRSILVAGSTMPTEERAVLDAYAAAGGATRALLVVAPRHPERFEEVARLLAERGRSVARRSAIVHAEAADIVLLDTVGELAGLYAIAAGCFVGGTLAPTGGHNPLEPARFGRAIAVGPSMFNFRDMAAQFDAAHAWRRVADGVMLGRAWSEWLDDPAAAAGLGRRAAELIEQNQGALERTRAAIAPLLARVQVAPAGTAR